MEELSEMIRFQAKFRLKVPRAKTIRVQRQEIDMMLLQSEVSLVCKVQ